MGIGGEKVILVRIETSPEDIHGMHAAEGILTARGGMTSHAAVVARGMGRPCVSGAGAISIDYKARLMRVGGREVAEGDGDHHRRLDRRGDARRGADGAAGAGRRFRDFDGLGRQCADWACAPTPRRRSTAAPRASSAPRGSASAAPSTCSSTPSGSPTCAR
jgi:hypothetical protein